MVTSTKKAFGAHDRLYCNPKGTFESWVVIVYHKSGDTIIAYKSIEKTPGYLPYTKTGTTHIIG